jgi:hypothetical protein
MKRNNSITKKSIFGLLTALAFAPISSLFAQATPDVDFTLQAGTGFQNYRNFKAGGAPVGNQGVIGFTVDITEIGGMPINASPMAAFCIEIAENVSQSSYTYDSSYLYQASAGRAGEAGTTSANILSGGIGQLRAARVRYLFDNFYQSSNLAAWTDSSVNPNIHAFQLSLWELSHDDDFSLSSTSGSLYIGDQTTAGDFALRNNAISLAQSWLTNVNGAAINQNYASTTFDVFALTSVTGNTNGAGFQDLVFAAPIGSTFSTLLPVPEPSSALLALTSSLLLIRRRR